MFMFLRKHGDIKMFSYLHDIYPEEDIDEDHLYEIEKKDRQDAEINEDDEIRDCKCSNCMDCFGMSWSDFF